MDNYWYSDPNELANGKFVVGSRISSFGGKQDYLSGQDNGKFKYGGYSYDPSTGWENPEPYAAIDPQWFDNGIVKPGDQIPVTNPKTGKSVMVTLRDAGPSPETGRGIDVSPSVLKQLGADTGDNVNIDFSHALMGKAPNVGAPPAPGSISPQDVQQAISEQPSSSMLAGNETLASIQQALGNDPRPIARNTDGSLDYGNGVSVYGSGIVQVRTPNTVMQWYPGSDKPHIINVNTSPKIIKDSASQLQFLVSPTQEFPSASIAHPQAIGLTGNPAEVDLNSIKPGDENSIPEDYRPMVTALANYNLPLSTFAMRSPYILQLLKMATKFNPNFDYKNYPLKLSVMQDFSSKGKSGQNITSFDLAMNHLAQALDASDKMKQEGLNTSNQPENFVKQQWYSRKSGNFGTSVGEYNVPKLALLNELERATSGAAPTEGSKKNWSELLSPSIPYEKQQANLAEAVKVLGARIEETAQSYKRTFGHTPNFSLISPKAEAALKRLNQPVTDKLIKNYGSDNGKKPYLDPNQFSTSSWPAPSPQTDPTAVRNAATQLSTSQDPNDAVRAQAALQVLEQYGGQ